MIDHDHDPWLTMFSFILYVSLFLIHLYPLDKSPEGWTVGGWDRERGGGWTSTVTSAALNTTDPEV